MKPAVLRVALLASLLLASVAACAKGGPPPPPPAPPVPTCDDAVDAVVRALGAKPDVGARLFADCRDKAWDDAKRQCAAKVVTPADAEACDLPRTVTCEGAVEHATGLIMGSEEMQKASEEEKKLAAAMVAGMRDEMVKKCLDEAWDQDSLRCVVDAKVMDDLEKCSPTKPE